MWRNVQLYTLCVRIAFSLALLSHEPTESGIDMEENGYTRCLSTYVLGVGASKERPHILKNAKH